MNFFLQENHLLWILLESSVCKRNFRDDSFRIFSENIAPDKAPLSINPFMLSRLFYLSSLDKSISIIRSVLLVFLSPCFIYIPVLYANSVDPDQMPHSLLVTVCQIKKLSHLWNARLEWIK